MTTAGTIAPIDVGRADVLAFRFRSHQLDAAPDSIDAASRVALLDYGVQDSAADGATWALANRGVSGLDPSDLVYAWTLRGAPHAYRRADIASVATATAPWSDADAGKRIFDAARPLRAAGMGIVDALRHVAQASREIVTDRTVKGDLSGALNDLLDEPFLRFCRPCDAIHVYEQPFRLAALQAGLELEPGTSPPMLRRIPGFDAPLFGRLADEAEPRFDVVRNHLRFFGPARSRDVSAFLDTLVNEVEAHWPGDVVEVTVRDEPSSQRAGRRFLLAADADAIRSAAASSGARSVRLLGPFDPYLQLRDRELLVQDAAHRKDLWRTLGRPGAIVADGDVIGTWRPKSSGKRLTVRIDPWVRLTAADRAAIDEQAERLAAHRGVTLPGVTTD